MRNVVLVADDLNAGAGTASVVPGPAVETPNFSDLKYLVRSGFVTLSNSGVSPSYIIAWVRPREAEEWPRTGPRG